MGTGASLLVLPEDLVEGLTTLQQTLEAAEAWTAEERDDLRGLLEHSRGVYEKRIDEARAHCEDLRKLRTDLLTDFSRLYESMYIILTKSPTSPTSTPRRTAAREILRRRSRDRRRKSSMPALTRPARWWQHPFAEPPRRRLGAEVEAFSPALKSRWLR